MTLDTRKFLSLLLIPVYIILITIFLILNISTSFNPPILLLVFNALFLGLIPLYAAYIAYKSYRVSGSNGLLLKGTGMLMIGLGAIIAGIVNYLPNSMNANVTVQNTGFCIGAFFQLIGILIALSGTMPKQRRSDVSKITILYSGCILGFSLFSIAAVLGAVPPFFIQGIGFTALREFIITSAIEFFVLSAGILLWLYFKKHENFFFWYSIGMALIGLGLLAVHFPSVLGSPLGWIGRSAQYIGGAYLLIAFISLNISAHRTGIQVSEMLSRFFGESETNYKTLIDTATDAIVVFDSEDRIIVWNRAAEKMFGYTSAEATGSSFFHRVIPDEFTNVVKNSFPNPEPPETRFPTPKSVEISARRKDGNLFPLELACSWNLVAGTWISTCILRDLTERKRTEASLLRLSSFPETNTDPIVEIDVSGHILYNNPSAVGLFPDLQMNNHPFLANLESTFTELIQGTTNLTVREVWVGDRCYQQSIHYLPEIQRVRIYGMEITERKKAENEVIRKNAELNEINEELTASEEELHQNVEELALREKELQTALAEKEVLLSEIHHRVKNNLTAFISLLSLDGSYEDSESGRALRKDLQNRARSMALIHETLYRTGKFSNVDMSIYLKNLVDQIAQSYGIRSDIKIYVGVDGTLSIDRATTAGLIINELVTNSFKYAFPPDFDCMALRGAPCTIRVSLAKEDGTDVLRVSDNGCGFPESFDPFSSKSLGLKLVNFLSRHQLLAEISIQRDKGTEFIFRLKNTKNNP
ncbi:MAG: PAS domain S-box protein [Methanoregula sp.]